jgi:hypothetical protein
VPRAGRMVFLACITVVMAYYAVRHPHEPTVAGSGVLAGWAGTGLRVTGGPAGPAVAAVAGGPAYPSGGG